ncbi:hypothetical protein STRIP9103_00062, partial [Streptomyces ipomoeae 91-03]
MWAAMAAITGRDQRDPV